MNANEKKRIDMIGKKYNKLTVVDFEYLGVGNGYVAICRCECGNETKKRIRDLRTLRLKSCGCHTNKKHGLSSHYMYKIYNGQKRRCEVESTDDYKRYGGRGIKCEWTLEEACAWYDKNPRPSKNHTLDRIDNNGNYREDNVKWSTYKEQALNTRNTENPKYIYEENGKFRVRVPSRRDLGSKFFDNYDEALKFRDIIKL